MIKMRFLKSKFKLYNSQKNRKMYVDLTISVIGLIGSGKTTLLNSHINKKDDIFPTAGFEIKYIELSNRKVLAYDCSG
jgi:septin family protein